MQNLFIGGIRNTENNLHSWLMVMMIVFVTLSMFVAAAVKFAGQPLEVCQCQLTCQQIQEPACEHTAL